jgi:hypothetical protein
VRLAYSRSMRLSCLSLVGVMVLVSVSACTGGDPKPNYSTVSPASAKPTASPTPSVATTGLNVLPGARPPVLPSDISRTASGAQVFAGYVVAATDWGYSTNDGTLFRSNVAASCEPCKNQAKIFQDAVTGGRHFAGGHFKIQSTSSMPRDPHFPNAEQIVDVKLSVGALKYLDASGKVIGSYPRQVAIIRYFLEWSDDAWRVINTGVVTQK